jgi:uncharacterized repeat protein (TIGR03803 family)
MCRLRCFTSAVAAHWAALLGLALAAQNAPGTAVITNLVSFNGNSGANPSAALIQATNGLFYGTTSGGAVGDGTIFVMDALGNLTNLVVFSGSFNGGPDGPLLQGEDGNFYGTTSGGGAFTYFGAIFRLTPAGAYTNLASFDGSGGYAPQCGLVQDSNAKLYGTTSSDVVNHDGTVFVVSPSGDLTNLVTFDGENGASPGLAGLVQGTNGNFYGVTSGGGDYSLGTVFVMTPSGALTTLFSFDGTNGANPQSTLALGRDGNFYGTAKNGGAHGAGTIFRMTPDGVLTNLYSFDGISDSAPFAGLIQAADGNFYGTTTAGGTTGFNDFAGAVFRMTPDGTLTILAHFDGEALSGTPEGTLLQARDGALYGTTYGYGSYGTVFKVTELPYIILEPISQTNMPGASVTFQVAAAGGFGPLSYQWQVGAFSLANNANVSGANSNVLALNHVTAADSGLYSVVVSNAFGSVISSNAVLLVAAPNPMVSITNPAPGTVVTNAALMVLGTASDRLPLSAVYYQLNESAWSLAKTTDGWSNWTAAVTLTSGVNTFSVYSLDNEGGVSATNSVQVLYEPIEPFLAKQRTFNGLFYNPNGVALEDAGAFSVATTKKGDFSGHLQFAAARYAFAGAFDTNGSGQAYIAPFATRPMTVMLQVDRASGSDQIYGTVSNGVWTAELAGNLAFLDSHVNMATQAGPYTMVIAGDAESSTVPIGTGYGTVSLDKAGRVKLAGVLADGTRFSQAASFSRDGKWPLFAPLYGGKGLLLGWVTNRPTGVLNGDLYWIKPRGKGKYYTNGFALESTLFGSCYTLPAAGGNGLGFTNGTMVFVGGNLRLALTNSITLAGNKGFSQSNKLSLSFKTSTGSFSGSFENPAAPDAKPIYFRGVVLQALDSAYGFFLGTSQSGEISLGP